MRTPGLRALVLTGGSPAFPADSGVMGDSGDMAALRRWGFRAWVSEAARPGAALGRVVRVDRGECDVITARGLLRVRSDSARAQVETAPVTGDWVEIAGADDAAASGAALIGRVLPRLTALSRRDPAERDNEQVLAANADIVGIMAGLDRPLAPGRFERLLVMALDSGASILVLLTKADRAKSAARSARTVRSIVGDVPVEVTSVRTGAGLDAVRSHLGPGRTLALIGASGSGKSSLANALAGDEVAAIGAVRPKDSRGRHTTVARELLLLPGDAGLVLDTPGVRSLGLWDAADALARVFGDIEELATGCRFYDCAHVSEPDCAVQDAIARGEISVLRVERARALRRELQRQQARVAGRRGYRRR